LRSITIGFNRAGPLVEPDLLYRIVVYSDPEMDGPSALQTPDASFVGRLRGGETFMTFNLVSPLRISEGSFVVGAIDLEDAGGFPALFDSPGRSNPPGSESFITFDDGASWRTMRETLPESSPCPAGSWLIRATVETDPADTFSVIDGIRDPLAAEPFGVAVNDAGTEVLVANYGSDNLSQIQTSDNSLRNVLVGDGPAGAIDGPAAVAFRPDGARAYVSLFGSEAIPIDLQSIDFSALPQGRVAVLIKQSGGAFAQSVQVNVGRGPLFSALSSNGAKLYVPCAGENRIDVINTTTNEKVKEIAVGANPISCTRSVDGSKLYVTNFGSSSVSVIDTITDQKIKDILLETVAPGSHPRSAAVSAADGNLYVASASTGIIEIDTCKDEAVRLVLDESILPAMPEGPGGLFAVASCRTGAGVLYTNSSRGTAGFIDTRIDQVVSAPALPVCSNPRGIDCATISSPTRPKHRAYVACGQPDNSVTVLNVPDLPENIADLPVIESISFGNQLRIRGSGFRLVDRVEVIVPGSTACLTFSKSKKFKKGGTLILQKGRLSDGRSLTEAVPVGSTVIIRLVDLNGSIRIFRFTRT
jgi:YVTN family beta-propeller protein